MLLKVFYPSFEHRIAIQIAQSGANLSTPSPSLNLSRQSDRGAVGLNGFPERHGLLGRLRIIYRMHFSR
jgi:hypothetical protein